MLHKLKKLFPSIAILTVAFSANSSARPISECKDILTMTPEQIETLQYSYQRGYPYNLGETIAAIAWRESSAGVVIINYQDPSASPWHVLAKTALSYEGIKDTPFNRNRILSKLATNRDYAGDIVVRLLNDLKKTFNGNRYNMYAAYNAGPTWANKEEKIVNKAKDYADDITAKVRTLSNCGELWKPKMHF